MYNVKVLTFSPIRENTYILSSASGEAVIIDPGCYGKEEEDMLRQWIDQEGLRPVLLLQTHCHLDHVFGTRFVADTWGLKPHIHAREQAVMEYAPVAGLMWNLPFQHYAGEFSFLQEGDITGIPGAPLRVLHTPGHSPGSISFHSAADGFVVSGDVLFQGSIGRTDLPGGDFNQLSESIRDKLYVLPDATVVYSGHGPATTIGREKKENPFVHA